MTLSGSDLADTRRYAGYPVQGALQFADAEMQGLSTQLDVILAGLDDNSIGVLQTQYLTQLRTLEAAIIAAGDNLDTDQAAVWKHNPNEVADRSNLYMVTRRAMCWFLGIPAGAGISPLAPAAFTTGAQ